MNEDIDLKVLINNILSIIKKRIGLIIVVFGVVLSYGAYKISTKNVEKQSSFVVISNSRLNNTTDLSLDIDGVAIQFCENISTYLDNNNYDGLGEKLNLSPQLFTNINELSVIEIDGSENNFKLEYSFNLDDYTIEITTAIVSYLNNKTFIKDNLMLIDTRDSILIAECDKEILKLDSVINSISINKIENAEILKSLYPHRFSVLNDKTNIKFKSKLNKAFYLSNTNSSITLKENILFSFIKYISYALFLSLTLVIFAELVTYINS